MGKRILCLALAAELMCAPFAMARAEDPARLREETPLGEELRPVWTPADEPVEADVPVSSSDGADAPQGEVIPNADLSAGDSQEEPFVQPTTPVSGGGSIFDLPGMEAAGLSAVDLSAIVQDNTKGLHHLGLSFGLPYDRASRSITYYNGYLKQESPLSEGYLNAWGYSGGNSQNRVGQKTISLGRDGYLYFCLPDMGRVPDLELEGLYLYNGAEQSGDTYATWVNDETVLRGWSYDEAHPENYKRLALETVAHSGDAGLSTAIGNLRLKAPTAGEYDLVRFPVAQVEEDLSFVYYVPADPEGPAAQWSIPIVAHWTDSGDSAMALFTMDIADTAAGTTQTVTDLYTKPFRQATGADHLTASAWTADYQTQTQADMENLTSTSVTRTATVFTPDNAAGADGARHYYLRVEEEQDSVTLRFLTQEPNYRYHITENAGGEEPVTVTASFTDKTAGTQSPAVDLRAEWDGDGRPFFPQSLVYGTVRNAQNTTALPARGQWTVSDIPLQKVSDAADPTADPFNTITVTITSPDKSATSVYVFHIERLMTPEIDLGYGNAPAGMIARDNSTRWANDQVSWGANAAAIDPQEDLEGYNRASALNYFRTNRTFRDMPIQPDGSRDQGGAIYKGTYSPLAWQNLHVSDPDLDRNAIVAYQDMAFDDPGVSFVDSEGHKVVFGQSAESEYKNCVTRTLELRGAAALTVDSYGEEGVRCWYNVKADGTPYLEYDETKAAQTMRRADGSDTVDLRGLIVLPGVYTAVYTFVDPVSHDQLTARRTVVVLPIPGDVDMDGAVTSADAAALEANAATWTSATTGVYPMLRNRVFNIDVGGSVSPAKLNAATIRQGFQPVLGATEAVGYSDYMYLPLPHSGDDSYHARKTWDEVRTLNGSAQAKLRLDFLGIEQGTWNRVSGETYTNNISGPWASPDATGDNAGVSIVSGSPTSGSGDVFWMGVYVEDAGAMAGKGIRDLSVSLVYDSEYVRPALVHAAGEGLAYGNDATRGWQVTTLMKYNFLDGAQGHTIFSGYNANHYEYTNSAMDRPYVTHYSKVEGDLELAYTDAYGQLNAGKLKEAVFSVQSRSNDLATMKEGYLLVLPFQLIRHPDERMDADRNAQLIELSAGMRDFSIVLDGASREQAGLFSLFSAEPRAAVGTTYAFSAQEDIYGNTTQNIRETLTYNGSDGLVPIGKDNTQRTDLTADETVYYDEYAEFRQQAFYQGHITAGALPPGMDLDNSAVMRISGTPTQVGVYDFSVDGQPYRITVSPKDIQYRAVAYSTYYGESEFRGYSAQRTAGQRDFTFEYRRADLADRDRAAAQALFPGWSAEEWGSGEELKAILTRAEETAAGVEYVPPVFYAQAEDLRPIGYKTIVGKYPIRPENQASISTTNYTLTYSTVGDSGFLTIEARPVWVSYFDISQDRSGSSIYNDQAGTNQALTIEERAGEELIVLAFDDGATGPEGDRSLNGRPLTGPARVEGDLLGLRFGADYVQDQADLDYVAEQGDQAIYRFLLEHSEEKRLLAVTQLSTSFIGMGDSASNYSLRGRVADPPRADHIEGTVIRRGVEAIEFANYPSILEANEDGTPKVQTYYGDKIIDPTSLHVIVTRGAGDGATHVGEYEYNNPSLRPMEIHYNWVSPADRARGLADPTSVVGTGWDPTLPDGQQDLRPYNGDDPLTPDMDGYYLCAVVKKYETDLAEDEGPHYIKVYSDHPIRVSKRTIVLTVQPSTRYYGEPNGQLEYTYNYQNLIAEEVNALRDWVRAETGDSAATPTGSREEMEAFFQEVLDPQGFRAPTLEASRTYDLTVNGSGRAEIPAADRVDETTAVGHGEFYIILQGAASSNYDFIYVRPRVVDNALTNQTELSSVYGFSRLTMMKRPIVISDVYSTDAADPKANFETIYADTKNLFLQNQTATLDRVGFALPENNAQATYFYRYGGSGDRIALPLTYADPAGPAVVNGDDVTIRYSVRFMCDPGHAVWFGFDNNYYEVAPISEAGGTVQKDVVVADLELLGDAAVNYELVYRTAEQAAQRAPSNVQRKTYPDPNHSGDNTGYLIHGTGAVTLRKITSMTLASVGKLDYTYGDSYAPYANNAVDRTPMKLVLNYETSEDQRHDNGDYERNVHTETLEFQLRQGVSNFTQRGLTIYYLKPGQSTQQAGGQILEHTTPLIPDEHDGARIFVTGKRRDGDPTVTSEVSRDALQVDKRALTLTVRNAHRFYGETLHVNDGDTITDDYIGTTTFTYSFPTAQLAQRDREELARLKGVAVSALPAVSTEADLRLLNVAGLTTPTYTADPGAAASVNKDSWGEYPIGITARDMAGYKVTGVPGTLYVYPRPVRVDDVRTSATDPVYTIYNQSSSKQFTTQLDTETVVLSRTNRTTSATGQEIDSRVSTRYCSDNVLRAMPLSGAALVGTDTMAFTVQLYFYEENGSGWDLAAGVADYAKPQVRITFRDVRTSDSSKNYAVSNVSLLPGATFERDGFWGAVKLRTIDEIFITGRPRTQYTYGETLDLSGLQVTIRYKALQGAGEVNRVNYLGPDSFKQVGLYVNYWYPEDPVPGGRKPNATEEGEKDATTTTDQEDLQRKELPNTYRRADTGDHVTIAPTHDTQGYIGAAATGPQTRPFAANGKYLIVSAFQEGDKQVAATPKVLGAEVDNTSVGTAYERENAPIPIVVAPLQLRYDLSAQDKTYDGTPRAAGTLTLENVFDATTQVKIEESQGQIYGSTERIRDVVYVPMGAAYEDHGGDSADRGYDAYRGALQNGVVSFTTGVYQPNGEAPLLENGRLDWSAGYEWGKGLTFTFADPNVHYLEAGESEPRAIGTQAMADYWRTAQAANDVKDQWDHYGEICAMPVEVTGMALAGPDAANYTWATDGTALSETTVTMTTRGTEERDQAAAPYATIHKANRATIQSMAGQSMVLPYLQLDEHTNVVRLFYAQDLAAMADSNNASGSADAFRSELHFEYALYYEGEDGLLTQWAGPQGDRGYQDTMFFGGELLQPEIDPAYVPDYDHLKTREEVKDDFIRKGQRYRWAEEDTGSSELGYREDAGVIRDLDAYPGGASSAELYYTWYYDLFDWGGEGEARAALPRDTVFYPLVRLSETHNYNASGSLSGDAGVTAQALDAAQKSLSKLTGAEGEDQLRTDAIAASADVFSAAQGMREAALALSAQRVADDAALAAEGKLPEEGRPLIGSAPAVKTFLQRLDLISGGWVRNNVDEDKEEYLVRTLEDVWFTDTLSYPETENMDAVVYNSPRRYYNYYWDVDQSARIEFGDDEMPIDFDTVMTAEIRQRQSDGSSADMIYTYDPAATGHTAQIYVQIVDNSGGRTIRSLRIVPALIYARLGDEPVELTVLTDPPMASGRRYTWESSDPSVVTVNAYGVLTFRGEGSAIITVTSANGRVATASVVVSPALPLAQTSAGLFNFQYAGPWALLDSDYAFRPKMGMTRGELVTLLDLFLNPSDQWQATQELAYIDVTGREKYYDALRRLTGAGVITGLPGGTFAGDQLATRAEFVTMLSRMLRLDVVDTAGMTHAFADTDETGTWAYAYIDAMAKAGVIRGVGGGDFAPNRAITREETAAILARLLTAKLDLTRSDLLRPSDMTPENWSYPAVLRAINTIVFPD